MAHTGTGDTRWTWPDPVLSPTNQGRRGEWIAQSRAEHDVTVAPRHILSSAVATELVALSRPRRGYEGEMAPTIRH